MDCPCPDRSSFHDGGCYGTVCLRLSRELGDDAQRAKSVGGYDLRHAHLVWDCIRTLVRLAKIRMLIKIDPSALGQTKWHEYDVRFIFGGCVTAVAGLIAKEFGPVVGGLFLAFPAIFPASATMVEKHEQEKKQRKGMQGARRGRQAASVDAAGAAIGSIGLLVFSLLICKLLSDGWEWGVLVLATVAWLAVSLSVWLVRKRVRLVR
jgi:hypothetical protein